jgi:putative multiple sugar transport system substrate-binding protein
MFGLFFVGCSSPSGSGGDDGHTGPVQIGIVVPNDSQRWLNDGNALLDFAEARGYQADVFFDSNQSTQNAHVRNLLDREAEVLIIAPIDTSTSAAIVDEAVQSGIKVIAYDRLIFGTADYDGFVTFNNYEVGQIQGQAIVDGLGLTTSLTEQNIVIFSGALYDGNSKFFLDGAMNVLSPYIGTGAGKLHVVDGKTTLEQTTTVNWDYNNAYNRMMDILADSGTPTLHGVLAANDTLARAIIAALRTEPAYDQDPFPVIVTGQDAEWDSVQYIINDVQYMTVYKNTWKLAEAAVILADHLITGNPLVLDSTIKLPSALSVDEKEIGNKNPGGVASYVDTYLLKPVRIYKGDEHILWDEGWFN